MSVPTCLLPEYKIDFISLQYFGMFVIIITFGCTGHLIIKMNAHQKKALLISYSYIFFVLQVKLDLKTENYGNNGVIF